MLSAKWVAAVLSGGTVLLALGCADGDPPDRDGVGAGGAGGAAPGPTVTLGTGEAEFEPIEGEPTLEMAAGFQGGFHIWTSFLATGFEDERLDMVLVTETDGDPDSALTMRATLKGSEFEDTTGKPVWTFAGYPGQIRDARCANGKRVHLSVTLQRPRRQRGERRALLFRVAR